MVKPDREVDRERAKCEKCDKETKYSIDENFNPSFAEVLNVAHFEPVSIVKR